MNDLDIGQCPGGGEMRASETRKKRHMNGSLGMDMKYAAAHIVM